MATKRENTKTKGKRIRDKKHKNMKIERQDKKRQEDKGIKNPRHRAVLMRSL